MNKDLEELLKENSHIVDLQDDIADICDGQKLVDIESALLMFLTDIYMIYLDHETSMERCDLFHERMINLLETFKEAEEKYKGPYVL